jgi:hypothetical protein
VLAGLSNRHFEVDQFTIWWIVYTIGHFIELIILECTPKLIEFNRFGYVSEHLIAAK